MALQTLGQLQGWSFGRRYGFRENGLSGNLSEGTLRCWNDKKGARGGASNNESLLGGRIRQVVPGYSDHAVRRQEKRQSLPANEIAEAGRRYSYYQLRHGHHRVLKPVRYQVWHHHSWWGAQSKEQKHSVQERHDQAQSQGPPSHLIRNPSPEQFERALVSVWPCLAEDLWIFWSILGWICPEDWKRAA